MEYDGAATWSSGCGPHVCAVGGYAGEDDDHAVCADVGLGVGVAELECVSRF